jgi:dihydroorotate dehydrogenase electron transfer subunit
MEFFETKIVEVRLLAPGYTYLRFERDREILGDPGQFVMVRGDFGTDPLLPRAFSLVASGKAGAILVREVGKATRLLSAMRPGDVLNVLGPLGNRFSMPKGCGQPILVAGGVGVAPLIFLAERLAEKGMRAAFLYGGRARSDLLLTDRIAESADLILTTEDGSVGEKGLVTGPLASLLEEREHVAVYACGPEPMLAALARMAAASKARLEVALEQAMACGMGTCKGCAVHAADGGFRYVCSDGPVFDARDVFGGQL